MKIVAITAGKGGTGKSCVTAYTGLALAQAGKRVLLIEMGADAPALDIIVGTADPMLFHMGDLLSGGCEMEAAMADTKFKRLSLLSFGAQGWQRPVDGDSFSHLLRLLPPDLDFVLLDGADFSVFPASIPSCILNVTTPDTLSVRAAAFQTKRLAADGAAHIRLVINNVPAQILPMAGIDDFDDIIDTVGAQLIAVIPASPKLAYTSNNTKPLAEGSLLPQIFERLAARLTGKNAPLLIR